MTDKQPRFEDGECAWCNGSGEVEFTLPDGTTERGQCDRCKGSGYARFDPADLSARTRGERMPEAVRIRLSCPSCGYRWDIAGALDKIAPKCWCPKCSATPPSIVDMEHI